MGALTSSDVDFLREMGISLPKPIRAYYEPPTSCYCAATAHPPCSWCETHDPDGENSDD